MFVELLAELLDAFDLVHFFVVLTAKILLF
jgi:hypothetical protein